MPLSFLKRLFRAEEEPPPDPSLVLLLSKGGLATADSLRAAAKKVWQVEFGDSKSDENFVVPFPLGFVVLAGRHLITVFNWPEPYTIDAIPLPPHDVYVTLDLRTDKQLDVGLSVLAPLVAALFSEHTRGVYCPNQGRAWTYTPDLSDKLARELRVQ